MHSKQASGSAVGLGLALLSATTFGTSGSFATSLIDAGWTPGAAVTTRITLAALLLTVPAVWQLRGRWSLLRKSAGMVLMYGFLAVAGAQLFFFNAVSSLSVGVALLLEYLGTVLVVGWLWLRHGQRPRRLTVIGALVAVLGLVLVLNLIGSQRLDPVGVMWGLFAAVGLAAFFLLSANTEEQLPPLVMAWAGLSVGALALLTAAATGILPVRAPLVDVELLGRQVSWIVPVVGLSLVAAVVAYIAGIGAARRLGAKLSSFVGLTEVIAAVLFAWLLLGQIPTGIQLLGGGLILAGVALVRIDELRTPAVLLDAHDDVRATR
jgi:drug/metabolite transporter (DMT)-like permease